MKRHYPLIMIVCYCLGIICYQASPGLAIDAFFDTEISTKLEPEPNTGTVYVTRLDEEVPPVFPDIVYEPVIHVEIIFDASKTMEEPDINGIKKIDIARKIVSLRRFNRKGYLRSRFPFARCCRILKGRKEQNWSL
jgi:hypothetical protein